MQVTEAENAVMSLIAAAIDLDDDTGTGAGDAWLEQRLGAAAIGQLGEPGLSALPDAEIPAALGHRIRGRLIREVCGLLCGDDADDVADRTLLGTDEATFVGAILLALTGALGVSADIAVVVAALVFRQLAEPTRDELCRHWRAGQSPDRASAGVAVLHV